jgi:hypothetical protein
MNNADKICKEALDLFTYSKDHAVKTIIDETFKGNLTLNENDLRTITTLVGSALENSFQKGFNSFHGQVQKLVNLNQTSNFETENKKTLSKK